MAGKRKKAKTAKTKEKSVASGEGSVKGLFDHIDQIHRVRDPNYFDTLSDADKKTWSPFMILKHLSLDMAFADLAASLLKYHDIIPPESLYKMLTQLPARTSWEDWPKNKSKKYPKGVVDFVRKYYEISGQQAIDYVRLLYMMDDGKKTIRRMMAEYGHDDKDIKEMFKMKEN